MFTKKKTIAFDFDGVIHSYNGNWCGFEIIQGEPVPGIKEVLERLIQSGYLVGIISSRAITEAGRVAMIVWLKNYNIPYSYISSVKQPALVYVDDRGLKFDPANISDLYDEIVNFKSWYEEGK